jgi:diacylglycerol kinase (ATP)
VSQGADLVIVLGGDGTVNEIVNGLAGHPGVHLAILPGGTANCLAMEIGLGKRIERAAQRLTTCVPRAVPVGRITSQGASRYFLLMCGAGLDARVIHDLNPSLKMAAGKLAYWAAGFAQIAHRVEPLEATVNGQTYRCGFLLASRIRNYGGNLEIASGASLLHPDFEVVLFEGSNPLRYALYMLGVLTRQTRHMPGVHVLRATQLDVLTPAHSQIDGEYTGRQPFTVEIAGTPVTLLLPPTYG